MLSTSLRIWRLGVRIPRGAPPTPLASGPVRGSLLADLPAVVVRTAGSRAAGASRAVDVGALAALEVTGRAVLLHTGGDRHGGHPGLRS
jgi:Cu/Zn superoxide dismutase